MSNLPHQMKSAEQHITNKIISNDKDNLTLCTVSVRDRGGYKLDTKSSARGLTVFTLSAAPSSCDMLSWLSKFPFVLTAMVTFFRQFFAVCRQKRKKKPS